MKKGDFKPENGVADIHAFATTRWSMVLRVEEGSDTREQVLSELCRNYWYPLYAFVRSQGKSQEDAEDLTQAFFVHLLTRSRLEGLAPERGRFRSFLLASCKRFMVDEWRRENAAKRGGGVTPLDIDTEDMEERFAMEAPGGEMPDRTFDRVWAVSLVDRVCDRLGEDYRRAKKGEHFDRLRECLMGQNQRTYSELAAESGMSEGGFTMAVKRLRQRFREEIRSEISETIKDPADVDDELRYLLSVLSDSL